MVGMQAAKAQFEMSNLSLGATYAPSMYFGQGLGAFVTSFGAKVQYEQDGTFYFGDFIYSNKNFEDLAETKITFYHLNAGLGMYLLGSADDDFNVAGKIGGGISMYDLNYFGAVETVSDASWNINVGIVANYNLSESLTLFAEPGLIFSAGEYNSRGNGTANASFNNLNLQIGAKFRFR